MVKIQVGKTYYTIDGVQHHITSKRGPDAYTDGLGHEWSENGTFYSCYEEGNPYYDLVKEGS